MPLTEHVALVAITRDVSTRSLLEVAAAIQKQVTRDLMPIWDLPATVNAFDDLASVPSDYHPVVVFGDREELTDQLELELEIGEQRAGRLIDLFEAERLAGMHLNSFTRQPFSLVAASDFWPIVASHEALEMLVDPFGNRLRAASHPKDPEQRVKYLLEVCDPCQSAYYTVNGVPVADFCTPAYFDPVRIDGGRYSFTGELDRPLDVLDGGYLTWIDPKDCRLYQTYGDGSEALLTELDQAFANQPLRTLVDTDPQTPQINAMSLRPARSAPASVASQRAVAEAAAGTARRIREAVWSLAREG